MPIQSLRRSPRPSRPEGGVEGAERRPKSSQSSQEVKELNAYSLLDEVLSLAFEGLRVAVSRRAVLADVVLDQRLDPLEVLRQVDGDGVRLVGLPRRGPVHLAHVGFWIVEVQPDGVSV